MNIFIKKYYPILPLILLCVFYTYKAYFFAIHDFANYYFGAYFFKEGLFSTDIYFPYYFNKNIAELGYQNIFVSYAPNTPFLSILFYPFTLLPLVISKLIFNILSSGLFLFSIIRLTNYFKLKKEYLLLLPILFFIPLKNNILFGQVYFLLFFLLSEGFLAYKNNRYKTMALFWSLAVFLKVFPIILVIFLIFKNKFKALKHLTFGCIILLLFSISLNGFDTWYFYFTKVLSIANDGEVAGAFVDNYQSLFMFLKRLLIYDKVYNSIITVHQPILFKAILIFVKLILVGIGIYFTKNSKNNLFVFSFWFLISVFISPYGSTYTFIIFILLYFSIIKYFKYKQRNIALILLFLIANSNFFKVHAFPLNYIRLFLLLTLISIIIWNIREKINFKIIGIIALLITVIFCFNTSYKENTTYLLTNKLPILTYDYSIKNDTLNYHYWNENGSNTQKTKFKSINTTKNDLEIKNNQVFYNNEQLTFDNANKMKPILINKNQIVFLSDATRGIGFYNLVQIKLEH